MAFTIKKDTPSSTQTPLKPFDLLDQVTVEWVRESYVSNNVDSTADLERIKKYEKRANELFPIDVAYYASSFSYYTSGIVDTEHEYKIHAIIGNNIVYVRAKVYSKPEKENKF